MAKKKNKGSHYRTDSLIDKPEKEPLEPCVKFVIDTWDKWESYWSDKMSDFEGYYDRWMGKPPQRDEEWQAQFHKKLTWQAEKTLVSRFHSALFPVSAPIDTEGTETQDELGAIFSKSLVAHWFKIGKFSKEFLSGMRSAGIYGTGLFEDDWYQRTEQVHRKVDEEIPDYSPMTDVVTGKKLFDEDGNVQVMQTGTRTVRRDKLRVEVVEDRYRVRKSNIFAWRIHPNKLTDDDDYPAMKQEFITYDDLIEKEAELKKYEIESFDNMDKIKADKFKIDESDLNRQQKDGIFDDDKNPRIELLHYYGLYAEKDDEAKKPMWIMVVNRKYKLKLADNPFWHKKPPLFHIIWTEDEKPSYYGIGIAQIGADAEDRANTNVNVRTDILRKGARRQGWYNATDKKISKKEVQKNVPGFMRKCSDVNNAFKYDEAPQLRPEDYKEEEVAVNDHREITGAATPMLPTADPKKQHKTLGGMELMLGQAAQRLKPDLVMMEMMGIRRMANRGFLLTRQFFSKSEAIELIASQDQLKQFQLTKIYNLSPAQILGKVNFHSTGLSESIEKAQNIDKLMGFGDMIGRMKNIHPIVLNTILLNIGRRIALWLGFEDVEKLIPIDPNKILEALPQIPPQGQPGLGPQQQPAGQGAGLPDNIIAQIASQIGQGAGV